MSGIVQGFFIAMLTPNQQKAIAAIHSSTSFHNPNRLSDLQSRSTKAFPTRADTAARQPLRDRSKRPLG